MPKITNDVMVVLTDEDKKLIRRIGYWVVAEELGLTPHYIRGLASRGERKMRKMDIEKVRRME